MPKGVYKRKKEDIERLTNQVTKHWFKKGMTSWNKGIKRPDFHPKYRLGTKASNETKKKMSEAQKGHHRHGWKIREDAKSKIKGKKLSKETRMKIGFAHSKEKHWNWQGGKTKRYQHTTSTMIYKQWRSDVFTRDNWTCQGCGARGIYLEAHHIKSWAKYPELRYILENGVTLCRECHKLTDNYKGKNNGYTCRFNHFGQREKS